MSTDAWQQAASRKVSLQLRRYIAPNLAMINHTTRTRELYKRIDSEAQRRWSAANAGNQCISAERDRCVQDAIAGRYGDEFNLIDLLEIGCGTGSILESIARLGLSAERLWGVDILSERISLAKERLPGAHLSVNDGGPLPFEPETFDVVVLFTVFSSVIDDHDRQRLANEAVRVAKTNGLLLIYDFRIPSHVTRETRPLTRKQVLRLFRDCVIRVRSLTVAPPIARSLGSTAIFLYRFLAAVPFLRTHNFFAVSKARQRVDVLLHPET